MWSGAIITPMLPCQTSISSGRNMHLNSRLRWVDNVETRNIVCCACAAMGYIYICRTHTQTTDFSQDTEHKNENGCNSFKYDSRIPATSRAHGDTDNFRHHHGSVAPLRTSGHQTWSSISNRLVSPHIACAPKHRHRISQIQQALNIECPGPVSHFSLWSHAADPVSLLPLSQVTPCLSYSHKHRPGLASHTRPGLRDPSHRHTRLLHARRILRNNANKLADLHLVSPHELSHQHSRVVCGFAIGHAIVSNPRQLCWITTFYQLMFMTLEDAWIETFLMGMRSNDDRFFQTHTRVPFLDKEITVNPINIPTKVSCICPFNLSSGLSPTNKSTNLFCHPSPQVQRPPLAPAPYSQTW